MQWFAKSPRVLPFESSNLSIYAKGELSQKGGVHMLHRLWLTEEQLTLLRKAVKTQLSATLEERAQCINSDDGDGVKRCDDECSTLEDMLLYS